MTTYTLQTIDYPSGRMVFYLHSEHADLAIPAFNSLSLEGPVVERVDMLQAGTVEVDDADFKFSEDYSNHSEGFWFKVLTGEAEIQLTLNDGNGEEHFFWGIIEGPGVDMDEIDTTPGYIERRGTFKAVGILKKMQDVSIADIRTEVEAVATTYDVYDMMHELVPAGAVGAALTAKVYTAITLRRVLSSILSLAYGQTNVEADVELPYHTGTDPTTTLKFGAYYVNGGTTISESPTHGFGDLYMLHSIDLAPPVAYTGLLAPTEQYNSGRPWVDRFSGGLDIVKAIAANFLFVPRHYYDVATGRHKLQLLDRRYSMKDSPLTFGSPKQSTFRSESDVRAKNIEVSRQQFANYVRTPAWSVLDGIFLGDRMPYGKNADIQESLEFNPTAGYDPVSPSLNLPLAGEKIFVSANLGGYNGLHRVGRCSVYVSGLSSYVEYSYPTTAYTGWMPLVVVVGLNDLFNSAKRGYGREYSGLKAWNGSEETSKGVQVLSQTSINDGVSSRTFYATEVAKDPAADSLSVKWVEV